jgi:YesN/AraC family two-component response regulator
LLSTYCFKRKLTILTKDILYDKNQCLYKKGKGDNGMEEPLLLHTDLDHIPKNTINPLSFDNIEKPKLNVVLNEPKKKIKRKVDEDYAPTTNNVRIKMQKLN